MVQHKIKFSSFSAASATRFKIQFSAVSDGKLSLNINLFFNYSHDIKLDQLSDVFFRCYFSSPSAMQLSHIVSSLTRYQGRRVRCTRYAHEERIVRRRRSKLGGSGGMSWVPNFRA